MPSHITVLPASTQAGKETIRFLLDSKENPSVRGIYRDPSKAPVEFTGNPKFEATKGDVGAGTGLNFEHSNAVFYVPPVTYGGMPNDEWATQTATNVANALKKAPNVKKLLLHSSLGAQFSHSIVRSKIRPLAIGIFTDGRCAAVSGSPKSQPCFGSHS